MESKAILKTCRISPYKARLVANEIKGYSLAEAMDILKAIPRKGAKLILKVLHSAGANAKYKNPDIRDENLYIRKIVIDHSVTMKRVMPRARGRASRIKKRTSHITIILSDK